MKRLNTEWGELESLVLKDMSDGECVCLQQKPASQPHCRYWAVAFHMSGLELDLQMCFWDWAFVELICISVVNT